MASKRMFRPAASAVLLLAGCFPAYEEQYPPYEPYREPIHTDGPELESLIHQVMEGVPLLAQWHDAGKPSYTPPEAGPLAKVVLVDDDFTSRPDATVEPVPTRDVCYEPFLLLSPKQGTPTLLDPWSGGWVGMQDLLDGRLVIVQPEYYYGLRCPQCTGGDGHGASAGVRVTPLTVPPGVGDHAAMLVVVRTGTVGELELGVAYAEDDRTELLNAQVLAATFHAGDPAAAQVAAYDSAAVYFLRAVLTKLPPAGGEPPARTEADRDYMAQRVSWLTALMVPRGDAFFRAIEDFWRRARYSEGPAYERLSKAAREAQDAIWSPEIRREFASEGDDPLRRTFEVTGTLRLSDGGVSCEVTTHAEGRDFRSTVPYKMEFSPDGRLRKVLVHCWSCDGSGDCSECPAEETCRACGGTRACSSCNGEGMTVEDTFGSRGRRLMRTDPRPAMTSDRSSPEAAARYYADLRVHVEYLYATHLLAIWHAEAEEASRFLAPELAAALAAGQPPERTDPETLRSEVVSVTAQGEGAEAVLRTPEDELHRLALARDADGTGWHVARLDVQCSECKEGGGDCAACGGDQWVVSRPKQ